MTESPRTRKVWLEDALIDDLLAADGFPLSTRQLCARAPSAPTHELVTAREIARCLRSLSITGRICAVRWPGHRDPTQIGRAHV